MLIDYSDWFRQFGTLATSKTGASSPIGVTADYKSSADALLETAAIPIMVLHAAHHKIISDSALVSTLVTFQNNQFHNVPGRTTSHKET